VLLINENKKGIAIECKIYEEKHSKKMNNVKSKIIQSKKQLERKMGKLNIKNGFIFTNLKESNKIDSINQNISESNIVAVAETKIFDVLDKLIQEFNSSN
jgi:hypothetical protein